MTRFCSVSSREEDIVEIMVQYSIVFVVLLIVSLVEILEGYRSLQVKTGLQKHHRSSSFVLRDRKFPLGGTLKKSLFLASIFPTLVFSVPQTSALKTMESAVIQLEQSSDRDNLLQAMENLYTTAETKSSVIKSKYKYVRIF